MPEDCRRVLEVEIPQEVVSKRVQTISGRFQRHARLPGFRPGKAPISLIQQKFRDDIRHQVLQELVPEYVEARAREQKWEPIGTPSVTDVRYSEDSPLRFKATLEVLPEIELRDYKNLAVRVEPETVSDQHVQAALEQLREQSATYVNLDPRPLQDGDFASISVRGVSPTKESPGVQVEEILCEIGGPRTVKEFTENLRGADIGEERRFDVAYPDDFSDARLAGKTISYQVKVLGLKRKQLPELNDDFAREIGEFDSLAAVCEDLRKNLLESQRRESEQKAKSELRQKLLELHDFPVPESLVERQIERKLERLRRQVLSQGMNPETMAVDWGKVRATQRQGATEDVKASLLLERIAEQENLQVSESEVEQELERIAAAVRQPPAAVRARLTTEGRLDRIISVLRVEKALDFVFQHAKQMG